MPGAAHESAISTLRERPDLLAKLVEKLRSAQIDPDLNPIDSTQRFANPAEVTPDLVFLGQGPRWAIVEVQNSVDTSKGRRWLLAASMLFNDHREIGDVIIITASRRVARWAAREMATFFREKMMELSKDPMTPWAREVLAKFEESGEARGWAKGKAEGEAEGQRNALLAVLSARELPISSAQKQRIQECADLDILDRWIRRAATASSAQEALEESARSPRNGTPKQARPATSRRRTSR